ncbi:PD40 domain-containing protein [Ectothiorhodospiraceae bacterium WFHF3C12]|nr:PD40 domain-containing protein [Ectothiorhodospiraceae bacterium WFHF3C12]
MREISRSFKLGPYAAFVAAAFLLAGCGGGGGGSSSDDGGGGGSDPNPSTVVNAQTVIPPGNTCPTGGVQIESGIDENANGVLDASEVDETAVVCNGDAGLTHVETVEPGTECPDGGTRVEAGVDANGNGVLDDTEVTSSELLCSQSADSFSGVVFTADVSLDGMHTLWRARYEGGTVRIAAPDSSEVINPISAVERAPDGEQVAFRMTNQPGYGNELYAADLRTDSGAVKLSGNVDPASGSVYGHDWSPNGQLVAYRGIAASGSPVHLYSILADGSGRAVLSGGLVSGGNVQDFAWAPDSQTVAYLADAITDDTFELMLVSVHDPGNPVVASGALGSTGDVTDMWWAPDGSRIAYTADQDTDGVYELYTSLPDGTANVKISGTMQSNGDVHEVAWSPDSQRIAFSADADTDEVDEIFTVNPDGTGLAKVHPDLAANRTAGDFEWAPDGSFLIYVADQATDDKTQVYRAAPDGGSWAGLSPDAHQGSAGLAQIAPDSSRVVFRSNDDGDGVYDLFSVNADGSGVVQVSPDPLNDGSVRSYRWSPDGQYIAYWADVDSANGNAREVYVVGADGSGHTQVVPTLPGIGYTSYGEYEWSADGSRIVYAADERMAGTIELFSVRADGSGRVRLTPDYLHDAADIFAVYD